MAIEAPMRKVTLGLAAGSAIAIIVWAVKQFAGVDVPAHIGIEGATVLNFVLQYLVPNANTET